MLASELQLWRIFLLEYSAIICVIFIKMNLFLLIFVINPDIINETGSSEPSNWFQPWQLIGYRSKYNFLAFIFAGESSEGHGRSILIYMIDRVKILYHLFPNDYEIHPTYLLSAKGGDITRENPLPVWMNFVWLDSNGFVE